MTIGQLIQPLRNLFRPVSRPAQQDRTEVNLRDLIQASGAVFSKRNSSTEDDLNYLTLKAGRVFDEEGEGRSVQVEAFSMDAGFRPIRIIIQSKAEPSPFEAIDGLVKALKASYCSIEFTLLAVRQAIALTGMALEEKSPLNIPEDVKAEMRQTVEDGDMNTPAATAIHAAWMMIRDMEDEFLERKESELAAARYGEEQEAPAA